MRKTFKVPFFISFLVKNWLYDKQFQLMSNESEPKIEWNFKNFSDRNRDTCFDIPQNGTELFVQLPERVEISFIRIIFRNPEHFQRMEIFVDDRTCHLDSKLPGEAVHLSCSQQPIGNRIKIQIWVTQLKLAICDIQAFSSKMTSQPCGIPPSPLNGYIRNETSDEFKFFCDSTFHLDGSDTTRCVHGRWSSETPMCTIRCATLPNLQNGHIAYDSSPVGNRYPKSTIATYFCSDRYNLIGNGSRYCRDDGTWSGVDSFCQCEAKMTHNLQLLSKKNVGFYARHSILRTETRNYVGQFSVHFLESDKMLGYWLPFYVNRLERTHFVILAELLPKKPTLILTTKLFNYDTTNFFVHKCRCK